MSAGPPSASGRIDLHSHLLPGIDDGCDDLTESLVCIRQLIAAGFAGSVCTPHVIRDSYPRNTPTAIARAVEQLAQAVSEAGLDYQLWPGGEVRLGRSMRSWLETIGVPTLGDSRWVLVDHWGAFWPPEADDHLAWLADQGYRVLLAHPERMELTFDSLDEVLARLTQRGVALQGNLNSFGGREGPRARELARRLWEAGDYLVLATDTHNPRGLVNRLQALAELEIEAPPERVAAALLDKPKTILHDRSS